MRAERETRQDSSERLSHAPAPTSQDPEAGQAAGHGFSLADVRAANRACVLAALAREGPLSRVTLARRLSLSRTTVSHIVAELLAEGRIREDGELPAASAGGRRATLLRVCDERRPSQW